MDEPTFVLRPGVAPHVRVQLDDTRESDGPDDDLVELGIFFEREGTGIAVALSADELAELRDALSGVIDREF